MQQRSEVILIGGRSGVGKSTAAFRLHSILADRDVTHAVIEGDALDLAHPAPWEHGLAELNLAALWGNYRALGYRRLIYTNTVSVLGADVLAAAMGDDPRVIGVLLRSSDDTAEGRLAGREEGVELERHVGRSRAAARRLDEQADPVVHRIDTDGRTPTAVAEEILRISGWA